MRFDGSACCAGRPAGTDRIAKTNTAANIRCWFSRSDPLSRVASRRPSNLCLCSTSVPLLLCGWTVRPVASA